MFEKIELYLNTNAEYAWLVILFFAFFESFILSGVVVSSAILFSICILIYNTELLSITYIVPVAVLGAHLGDMTGFLFGKTIGPQLLSTKVILGRFIPAVRPIVPFLLGISDLKIVRFYIADLIACICWGIALGFLVTGVGSMLG